MRIVLDTNVALSALLGAALPIGCCWPSGEQADARLFSSPALIAEQAEVLGRPSPGKRLAMTDKTAFEVLADYSMQSNWSSL